MSRPSAVLYQPDHEAVPGSRLYALAESVQRLLPLSMRGLLVLLILVYLLLNPIFNNSDIVASVVTATIGVLILLIVFSCAIAGLSLRRTLMPEVLIPGSSREAPEEGIFAQMKNDFLVRPGSCRIPPLYTLSLELQFEQPGVSTSCHLITGQLEPGIPIVHQITFPHRGLWKLSGVRCLLEDRFGFSCVIWTDRSQKDLVVAVQPPPVSQAKLPIISSTFRPGDDLSHNTQRMGEPFDIKPYHPSDGIRKILWKVFAKRGELVARHPENAVTPEGHVIAWILASREDDQLASWSLAYFRGIEEMNLTLEAGCLGMGHGNLARNSDQLSQLLVSSAFNAPETLSRAIANEIQQKIGERSSALEATSSIALFISERVLDGESSVQEILAILAQLESAGLSPVVCLLRTPVAVSERAPSNLERLLLEPSKSASATPSAQARNSFLKGCSAAEITVYQEPFGMERVVERQ